MWWQTAQLLHQQLHFCVLARSTHALIPLLNDSAILPGSAQCPLCWSTFLYPHNLSMLAAFGS